MWQASKLVWRLVNGKGGKRKEGKRREKRALTVISDSPCSTTYFLTALVRVTVLIHAQRNVYIFRNAFFQNLDPNSSSLPLYIQALFPKHKLF